jgi:hypothetical protein
MNLSDEQVEKFQVIFRKEYGRQLSKEDARESADNLIRFLEIVLPIAKRIKDGQNG